ncbi:MAG TPA: (2Fe-2S)-binding protein [bacterium]|nr:(2Fe-2S)-binding protein [bacterium]
MESANEFVRRVGTHGAVARGSRISIEVDGEPLEAYVGETLAAAMLAAGRRVFHHSLRTDSPRGMYCGMGVCFECLMVVNGQPNVRACMTPVLPGMRASTQHGPVADKSPVPNWECDGQQD